MTTLVKEADAVIVGGGPAGAAAAIALRQRGVEHVVIVDAGHAGDTSAPRIGESVPPDTRQLLDHLGMWPAFEAQKHAPCLGSRSSWGSPELGYNDFLFNIHGHGWHLDRRRFDSLMLAGAERAGARLCTGTRVSDVRRVRRSESDRCFRVDLAGQRAGAFEARFLIDATGAKSRVARALGARPRVHDRLLCIAAFLDDPGTLGSLSLLEAVEHGWWYAAEIPGQRAIAMLATDPAIARHERMMEPRTWRAHLARTLHVRPALGVVPDAPELIARGARSFLLDRVSGPGWLAVGDAASAYDPLSAQGLYKALYTGLYGGTAAARWLAGEAEALHDYDRLVMAGFGAFLRGYASLYRSEERFPDAPFWTRRHLPIPSRPRRPASRSPRSATRTP